ncbi:hypothetical protein HELRODRAFT_67786, partial [Helobdella robusta]|uniref:PHD finger protein 10 n=1 Tax=Helobdella robusta TaxID=6412 RepID=T1FZ52_HELRO
NIVEYQWPQARNAPWYILQEHISEYLGVLSFKRKYPNISRRPVEYQERQYLIDQGCVTEVQCDLGLTVLNAEEVLKLMSKDYPEKYQAAIFVSKLINKMITIWKQHYAGIYKIQQEKIEVTKLENLMKKAIKSAAEFNASLCKDRRQARSMYIDLQTMELHKPQSRKAVVNYSSVNLCDSYPVALVPGQYQHYYKRYTPTELNYFPLNTALYAPPKMMQSIYVDPNQPEKEASDEDVEQEEAVDDLTSSNNRPTRTRTTLSNNKKFQPFSTSSITNEDSNTSFGSEKKIRKGGPGRGKKVNSVRCGMCSQTTKNKYNEPDDLIKCNTCNVSNHPGCLGLSAEMVPMIKTYDWQCMECKVCYQCTQPHDEDKMMFCDNCDRGYHTYCVGLISIPEGRWDCVMCTTNNNINESIINNNTNDSSSNINFTENSNSVASNDNSNIGFSFFQNNSFKFPSSFSPTAQTGVGALSNISRPSSLKSRFQFL